MSHYSVRYQKRIPYEWLRDVIDSCTTPEHIKSCGIVMGLYEAKYGFSGELATLASLLVEREVSLKHFDKVSETY